MKDIKKVVWGAVLLAAGVVLVLNALEITDIDLWFKGWWTLFIIIPCGVGVFTERDKTGNLIGLGIGILLLVCAQGILDFAWVWKLALPVALIILALKMIIHGVGNKNKNTNAAADGNISTGTAIFGGKDLNFNGQSFDGAELTAIFGGVECDLRGAVIEKDCSIKATSIFGGIDIMAPDGVNVKVSSTNIFGGTSDDTVKPSDATVTVYIEAVSIFGGVDIK